MTTDITISIKNIVKNWRTGEKTLTLDLESSEPIKGMNGDVYVHLDYQLIGPNNEIMSGQLKQYISFSGNITKTSFDIKLDPSFNNLSTDQIKLSYANFDGAGSNYVIKIKESVPGATDPNYIIHDHSVNSNNTPNIIYGKSGVDKIYGGDGTDWIDTKGSTTGDREVVIGGTGSDHINARNGLNSHYHGDDGNDNTGAGYANNSGDIDTLSYVGANQGVHLDLEFQTGHTGWFGSTLGLAHNNGYGHAHFVSGFERVWGSRFNDRIEGGSEAITLQGFAGNDILQGSLSNDSIYGDDGNDELHGKKGDDKLEGGAGNDTLHGGDGDDTLIGDLWYKTGLDNLYGGAGNDTLDSGGSAAHEIEMVAGGTGSDTIIVRNSGWHSHFHGDSFTNPTLQTDVDTLDFSNATNGVHLQLDINHDFGAVALGVAWNNGYGQRNFVTGFEKVKGSNHNDSMSGTDISETFEGGLGKDRLQGGNGDDQLHGGDDNDWLYGEGGNDTLHGGLGYDDLYGGLGHDTADYSKANSGIHVNLEKYTAFDDGFGTSDYLLNIEEVQGSQYDDKIYGSAENESLHGNAGNDTIYAGVGGDTLSGGTGADTFVYKNIADSIAYLHHRDINSTYDVIKDFESGTDKLDFSDLGLSQNMLQFGRFADTTDEFFVSAQSQDGVMELFIKVHAQSYLSLDDILF